MKFAAGGRRWPGSHDLRDALVPVLALTGWVALDREFERWTDRPGDDVAVIASDGTDGEEWASVDYTDRLRSLGLNDARFAEGAVKPTDFEPVALDQKTLELVRLAALVAVGGAVPSYGAQTDSAVSAGATAAEIVDVLVGVIPVVGLPCVVAAAPKLALALGYDLDDALERQPGE
jgi:4-carboxymuconolactone decarboxylase